MTHIKNAIGLLDCNNFYASCERLFRPDLAHQPIVVLSNNDGCVIARSNEAKALGVPMGAPSFKWKEHFKQNNVQVFSSNYALYGDLSNRVMDMLNWYAEDVEVYSVDEAFVTPPPQNLNDWGQRVRTEVRQLTGIPISIGFAQTKTLSKIANKFAKKLERLNGVLDMTDVDLDKVLVHVPVSDVWGIGPQYAKFLEANNIANARQLRDLPDKWIREKLTVMGLRTVWELRGESCISIQPQSKARQTLTYSRSFGEPITDLDQLSQSISSFVGRAAAKMRQDQLVAGGMTVFITTKDYTDDPRYANSQKLVFPQATDYTPDLVRFAHVALHNIFQTGFRYRKAGVIFTRLVPKYAIQQDLFTRIDLEKQRTLMETMDAINAKFGKDVLFMGANGTERRWTMRSTKRSPRYTSRWNELMVVR
jgi:DNA polymerase V